MCSTAFSNEWIAHRKPNIASRIRLFCFPYAGGGASIYRSWAGLLPPSIDVFPIQLPGRENRIGTPACSCLDTLTDKLTSIIANLDDAPFALFGHSMGALIAFELARKMRERSLPGPEFLFVSGRHAPRVQGRLPSISHLRKDRFMKGLHKYNGTPMEVLENAELMDLVLPTLRADFRLNEEYTYIPKPPLECPISAFSGLNDTLIPKDGVLEWAFETADSFKIRMLPGDHFFLKREQLAITRYIAHDLCV